MKLIALQHCEIPASAGMVCLGTGDLCADLAIVRATIWRVAALRQIPAFAGMVCGGIGFGGVFADNSGDNFADTCGYRCAFCVNDKNRRQIAR